MPKQVVQKGLSLNCWKTWSFSPVTGIPLIRWFHFPKTMSCFHEIEFDHAIQTSQKQQFSSSDFQILDLKSFQLYLSEHLKLVLTVFSHGNQIWCFKTRCHFSMFLWSTWISSHSIIRCGHNHGMFKSLCTCALARTKRRRKKAGR